jgi:hypothetical protein
VVNSHTQRPSHRLQCETAGAEAAAFGELYDRHFLQIYRFVYRRVAPVRVIKLSPVVATS